MKQMTKSNFEIYLALFVSSVAKILANHLAKFRELHPPEPKGNFELSATVRMKYCVATSAIAGCRALKIMRI